jgi:uncharacterized alkaline shock family protein YloU
MTTDPAKSAAPPRAEPADRGRLHISALVLRRIAEHAAHREPGTVPARRGRGGQPGPAARVRGNGEDVEFELDVALIYPQPVREAAQRLRTAVTTEVARLTGRRVRRVAVNIVGLLPDIRPRVE